MKMLGTSACAQPVRAHFGLSVALEASVAARLPRRRHKWLKTVSCI